MRTVACALSLALVASPVSGETQLYVERAAPEANRGVADDTQLRRSFAGPMPRTGEAQDVVLPLLAGSALSFVVARMRDGPGDVGRRG